MKNSIRWLLTESKISNLNPNEFNFIDGKLICYHLTSHQKWANYNKWVNQSLENPITEHPKQERSADDSRAVRIVKNLKDANRITSIDSYDIEESVIMDMIDDPYTDTSGFEPGVGKYHGKGLYTCYRFNPKISYLYGDICLVFEIDISNFLITFEDLAKQVHGENWRIKDQLLKLYSRNVKRESSLKEFEKVIDSILPQMPEMLKDIKVKNLEKGVHTAGISNSLVVYFGDNVTSLYDGAILFGRGDGPVCVSFYPKYDAKLIGLGRLSSKTEKARVDWYDSLNDFLGGRARNKLDFQTMNDIAEENTSIAEKEEMKDRERVIFDIELNFITIGLQNSQVTARNHINIFCSLYNEILNIDKREEGLDLFYRSIASGNYIHSLFHVQLDKESNEKIKEYANILENAYYYVSKLGQEDLVENLGKNVSMNLDKFSGIQFSDKFILNCVLSGINKVFSNYTDDKVHDAKYFFKSAEEYINSTKVNEEFKNEFTKLKEEYWLDVELFFGSWKDVFRIYTQGDQTAKQKVYNMTFKKLSFNPFKNDKVYDSEINKPVYNKINDNKELIDIFCEIVQGMFNNQSFNVAENVGSFFKNIKHKASDWIVSKAIQDLEKIQGPKHKQALAICIKKHVENFDFSHLPEIALLDKLVENIEQDMLKTYNKVLNNLSTFKAKQSEISYRKVQIELTTRTFFENQSKEWRNNFIQLIIQNINSNPKFDSLKINSVLMIAYILCFGDIVLRKSEQKTLIKSAGKFADFILACPGIDNKIKADYLKVCLSSQDFKIFKKIEHTSILYDILYNDKIFLSEFIDKSNNATFKKVLKDVIDILTSTNNKQLDLYCREVEKSEQVYLKDVIDANNTEWFNYLLEEIRTKTNSGQTKNAVKLFKELDTLMMQKGLSQEVQESELDLSHRKIFGNSLKEVYRL